MISKELKLSGDDIQILKYMTGCGSHIQKRDWGARNYFETNTSGKDYKSLVRLNQLGYVIREPLNQDIFPDGVLFRCTELGCRAAGMNERQIVKCLYGRHGRRE
ncbi:MAG: hypothetical protein NPIRA02_10720 [Nitrospirales bacterium]|nr:MAG: hypothetical protein NPIRA02_10720 [Nitrospirales bacterium]